MSRNPWLAIDAATSPMSRARELRRDWEQYVGERQLATTRGPIATSWERSRDAGVDPFVERVAPVAATPDEVSDRWGAHPLAAAAPIIRKCLGNVSDDAEHLVVVSDADGVLLSVEGNARVRLAAADTINFTEGRAGARKAPARMRSGPRSRPTTRFRCSQPSTSTKLCRRGPARPRPSAIPTPARYSVSSISPVR